MWRVGVFVCEREREKRGRRKRRKGEGIEKDNKELF